MSVEDNLKLGAYSRRDTSGIRSDMDKVYDLFPVLSERRTEKAGLFSGGEQQMLAIGRAMMSRPKLLMLDEPSMGLSPIMTQTIMRTIRELQSEGVTILLVEQNAQAALSLADVGYVLEVGQIMFSDTGRSLLGDDRVKRTYLGAD
jgi:branched-chain amino acid transport system ATP-binding protein